MTSIIDTEFKILVSGGAFSESAKVLVHKTVSKRSTYRSKVQQENYNPHWLSKQSQPIPFFSSFSYKIPFCRCFLFHLGVEWPKIFQQQKIKATKERDWCFSYSIHKFFCTEQYSFEFWGIGLLCTHLFCIKTVKNFLTQKNVYHTS